MKKLEKIIEYGLYFLVFVLPIQTRLIFRSGELSGGYSEYSTLSVYASDILLLLLFVCFTWWRLQIKESVGQELKKIWYTIIILDVCLFVSIFFSHDQLVTTQKYLWFLLGTSLFWIVTEARYSKTKLLFAFLLGAFLQSIIAIWQFFVQKALAFKWLGWSEHRAFDLGHSVIETMSGERWLRSYGGLDHPNILGGYLVLVFICFASFFVFRKTQNVFSKQVKRIAMLAMSLTVVVAIFFSFSRSAWLSLFLPLAAYIALLIKNKGQLIHALKLFLLSLTVFVVFSSVYSDLFLTRLGNSARLEQKSTSERIESAQDAKAVIKRNWLMGVGHGNYTIYLNEQSPNQPAWSYQPSHNFFLLVFSELGVIGLMLYVFLLVQIVWQLVKAKVKKNQGGLMTILALLIISMFDHWLFSLHFGVLLFWLVLGISIRQLRINN